MARAMKIAMVALICAALVLQPVAAYNFNFGGGGWFPAQAHLLRFLALLRA